MIVLSTLSMDWNEVERTLTTSIGELQACVHLHKGINLSGPSWTEVVNHVADPANARISIFSHWSGKTISFYFVETVAIPDVRGNSYLFAIYDPIASDKMQHPECADVKFRILIIR